MCPATETWLVLDSDPNAGVFSGVDVFRYQGLTTFPQKLLKSTKVPAEAESYHSSPRVAYMI